MSEQNFWRLLNNFCLIQGPSEDEIIMLASEGWKFYEKIEPSFKSKKFKDFPKAFKSLAPLAYGFGQKYLLCKSFNNTFILFGDVIFGLINLAVVTSSKFGGRSLGIQYWGKPYPGIKAEFNHWRYYLELCEGKGYMNTRRVVRSERWEDREVLSANYREPFAFEDTTVLHQLEKGNPTDMSEIEKFCKELFDLPLPSDPAFAKHIHECTLFIFPKRKGHELVTPDLQKDLMIMPEYEE